MKPEKHDWVRGKLEIFSPNDTGKTLLHPFRLKEVMIEGEGIVRKVTGSYIIELVWEAKNLVFETNDKKQIANLDLPIEVGDKVIFMIKADYVKKDNVIFEVELVGQISGQNPFFLRICQLLINLLQALSSLPHQQKRVSAFEASQYLFEVLFVTKLVGITS